MKFNTVIGNPPYNNDLYLDFVTCGHQIADKYSLWITPAKWQAKGGYKNKQFRQNIVPYIKDVVYYPQCKDIFNIGEPDGITYYIIDKHNEFNVKTIENRCDTNKYYNDTISRTFKGGQDSLNNKGQSIINKLGDFQPYLVSEHTDDRQYQYWINSLVPSGIIFSNKGTNTIIGCGDVINKNNIEIMHKIHPSYYPLFTSDSMLEVASFLSYTYTKFVRFLIFNSICGLSAVTSDPWWRFVPAPVAFDHLFTDEELYKKYNLTPDEIAIIEGTIAERPFSTVWSWIPKEYQELANIK